MTSPIVITATDDAYFPLALTLIRSLLKFRKGSLSFDIGVLDVGLSPENRAHLQTLGVIIEKANADLDYPLREEFEALFPFARAMTSRPFLPYIFKNYELYLWMDSDTWLQTDELLKTVFTHASRDNALYIGAEFDRDYKYLFTNAAFWQVHFNWYKKIFPQNIAQEMSLKPMLNCGVFALQASSPAWKTWQDICLDTFKRMPCATKDYFMAEQLSLNVAVYVHKQKAQILPAEYNWLCHLEPPAFDTQTNLYVRPGVPHTPLSVLHLAGNIKNNPQKLRTTDGKEIMRRIEPLYAQKEA